MFYGAAAAHCNGKVDIIVRSVNRQCFRSSSLLLPGQCLLSSLEFPEPFSEQSHLPRNDSSVLDRSTMSSCGDTIWRQILPESAFRTALLIHGRPLTTSKKGRTSTRPGVFLQSLIRSMAIANIPSLRFLNNQMKIREGLTHQVHSGSLHPSIRVFCQDGREGSACIGVCPD